MIVGTTLAFYLTFLGFFYHGYQSERSKAPRPPEITATERAETRATLESDNRLGHFAEILFKNLAAITIIVLAGALSLGFFAFWLTAHAGIVFGMEAGVLHQSGFPPAFLRAYFLSHGLVEILALSLAGTLSLVASLAFLRYLRHGRLPQPQQVRTLKRITATTLVILLIAAVLEVWLTPHNTLPHLP